MADTTKLFEKYGEFDSYKELNAAAAGQLEQGDTDALKELAKENGIDEWDVEDYIDGTIDELATVHSAAAGRLAVFEIEIEKKSREERKPYEIILMFTKALCQHDEKLAAAVMKKGKRITEIFNELQNEASKHKKGNVGVSCGTDEQLRQIIRTYFTETESAFKKKIQELYE